MLWPVYDQVVVWLDVLIVSYQFNQVVLAWCVKRDVKRIFHAISLVLIVKYFDTNYWLRGFCCLQSRLISGQFAPYFLYDNVTSIG